MKRRVGKVVLFLLLGATLNVAVAWILTETHGIGPGKPQPTQIPVGTNDALERFWNMYAPKEFEAHPNFGQVMYGNQRGYKSFYFEYDSSLDRAPAIARECAVFNIAGIPEYSLAGYRFYSWKSIATGWIDHSNTFLRLGDDRVWLPLRPIWPGFAINTIFYAAVLWLLFAFPFALRRRRRIKRGMCPACGYPIGSSPMCTECGKQLKAIRVESAG